MDALFLFIMECKWYKVCPMKSFCEQGRISEKWVLNYCKGNWENCVRYKMEEAGEYHPDNMLPDGSIKNDLLN